MRHPLLLIIILQTWLKSKKFNMRNKLLFTEGSSIARTFKFSLLLISAKGIWFRYFWWACDLQINFGITIKLRKVRKKFKSVAALRCLKSTFSNLRTNLPIVPPYRLQISCNNGNLLGNLRRTKNIKINASVL